MGTSWGQVVKENKEIHPGIAEYTKCQSKVFFYSTISTAGGKVLTNVYIGLLILICFKLVLLLIQYCH